MLTKTHLSKTGRPGGPPACGHSRGGMSESAKEWIKDSGKQWLCTKCLETRQSQFVLSQAAKA
jgi:hypothetical protein